MKAQCVFKEMVDRIEGYVDDLLLEATKAQGKSGFRRIKGTGRVIIKAQSQEHTLTSIEQI